MRSGGRKLVPERGIAIAGVEHWGAQCMAETGEGVNKGEGDMLWYDHIAGLQSVYICPVFCQSVMYYIFTTASSEKRGLNVNLSRLLDVWLHG